jgi:hypothetical protein
LADAPAAFVPIATAASIAGGVVQTFIPDRKLPRPAIRLALIAALTVPLYAGCVSTRSDTTAAARKAAPANLMPGEQVDYAGHRCGNPNMHVKTHPCLFPSLIPGRDRRTPKKSPVLDESGPNA